ncbi:hypothetical protein [Nostoc sp. GT001]|uniref:hypothetical protein n=1 Tax=Nostoc sp. GT001 TaxID=3056647 RepID=UPI0025AA7E36|nr:hypothetical protein [Nostoc sp. GT001]MDM9584512.1 hypothetical protein [Nostoc sp. GT001]
MEPLTAGAIATLALKTVFGKTIEKLTEVTLAKINVLRNKIWNKLQGKEEAATAFVKAEKGSKVDLDWVVSYLQEVMKSDTSFATEVEKLASEIQQEINIGQIKGQNVQNVYGGEAQQNNANNNSGTIYQGNNTIHNTN